jgi:integrase
MKVSKPLINLDGHQQRKQFGSIKKFSHSKKLYVDFYYFNHRVTKSTGLDDTPVNRELVLGFLNRNFDKIEQQTFRFAEAFPGAKAEEKAFFSKLEGWEFHPEPNRILIGEYLVTWMEKTLPTYKSVTKRNDFTQIMKYHLVPYFEKVTFYQLTSTKLQEFVSGLVWREGKNEGKQLSTSRIRNILIPLRKVWNDACDEYRWNIRSPFDTINDYLPEEEEEKEAPEVFRFEEWQGILKHIDPFYHPLVEIMLMTGMIGSELSGLRKIDIEQNHINIRNSIVLDVEKKKLKNRFRRRKTPLTKRLRELLSQAMAHSDSNYVFVMKDGRKFSYGSFRKTIWDKAIIAAELSHKTPYITRHTFAAWALTIRIDPNRLVNLMGHASKKMVYETYGNYVEGLEQDAERILDYFGADFLRPEPSRHLSMVRMERCDAVTGYEAIAV